MDLLAVFAKIKFFFIILEIQNDLESINIKRTSYTIFMLLH